MPRQMGNEKTTIQNLEVVFVDVENKIILIKGNVPGPKKSLVMIKTSVKKGEKVNEIEELISYQVIEEEIANEEVVEETTTEEAIAEEANTEE